MTGILRFAQNDSPSKVFQRPVKAFMERAWGFYPQISQISRIVWLAVLGSSIESLRYSRRCYGGSPTRRKRSWKRASALAKLFFDAGMTEGSAQYRLRPTLHRILLSIAKYSDTFYCAPLYERRKTRVADPRYSGGCHYILRGSVGDEVGQFNAAAKAAAQENICTPAKLIIRIKTIHFSSCRKGRTMNTGL